MGSRGQWSPGKDPFCSSTRAHTHVHTQLFPFVKRDRIKGAMKIALLLITELMENGERLVSFSPMHTHVHAHIHDSCARTRAHIHFRGQEDDANLSVSSVSPHDTDDQDQARAIRTRRWRRQLFCGTNRARAPRPWRTYLTPSWGCHPRRVPRVLARGDPS